MLRFSGLLLTGFLASAVAKLNSPSNGLFSDYNIRVASSGGGWRAMTANMGVANALHRAGVLPKLSAWSTNSGASWFSTQFFYSPEFYQRTIGHPSELYNIVENWMDAYVLLQEEAPTSSTCDKLVADFGSLLDDTLGGVNVTQLCDVFVYFNGDWAYFIGSMLDAASASYGDYAFANRTAGWSNRHFAASSTDLFVQASLAPVSRVQSSGELSYITTGLGRDTISVPIAAQYAVKSDRTFFNYALHDELSQTLSTLTGAAPSNFTKDEFESFALFPGQEASVWTPSSGLSRGGVFRDPFGGAPTVSDVAAASSATIGSYSGDVPSTLAQTLSVMDYAIGHAPNATNLTVSFEENFLVGIANELYQLPFFDNTAVCTQWPQPCTIDDGRLLDGSYSDGLTVALNIGQYQLIDGGDLETTLKLIVIDSNYVNNTVVQFLSYFSTDFNQNVAPGDFIWAPATSSTGAAQKTPWRSMQVFEDWLDETTLAGKRHGVPGTNLTTALIEATTIDNAAFGVAAGQRVEILLIEINSAIPTILIGPDLTESYKEPLAGMAENIASSEALVAILEAFVV